MDEWNPEKKLRRKKRGPSAHQEHAGALSGRTEDPKREYSLASKQPSTPYSNGNLLPSAIYENLLLLLSSNRICRGRSADPPKGREGTGETLN